MEPKSIFINVNNLERTLKTVHGIPINLEIVDGKIYIIDL